MKTKTRTRLLSLLVTLAMVLTSFAVVIPASADAWDGSAATAFAGGEGTAENPFVIETAAQFKYFADTVNAGESYAGKYIVLGADIDLSDVPFTAIGAFNVVVGFNPPAEEGGEATPIYANHFFKGTLDGQGHSIVNVNVTVSGGSCYGLFTKVENAAFKNLTLDIDLTAKVTANDTFIGAFIGGSTGSLEVTNVTVTGTMDVDCTGMQRPNVGGLLGGTNNGTTTVTITDCATALTVDAKEGTSTNRMGGLIGALHCTYGKNEAGKDIDDVSKVRIVRCETACAFTLAETGTNHRLGGLVGCVQYVPGEITIIGCDGYNTTFDVASKGALGYGPFVGYSDGAPARAIFATYGENGGDGQYFVGSANRANTYGKLSISAKTADGKVTVSIHRVTADWLNRAFAILDDVATEDVNEFAAKWSVVYNGVTLAPDAAAADELGNLTFVFDAAEGANVTIDMDGLKYNLKGDEEASPFASFNANTDPIFAGGKGTADEPYLIATPTQLALFGLSVVQGTQYVGQYVALAADIDMKDIPWTMYKNGTFFKGTFDGQGHTISNFNIKGVNTSQCGLFARIENATIKNVTILSPKSEVKVGANQTTAIVAGHAMGVNTFTNVHIEANFTAHAGGSGGNNFGGFIGEANTAAGSAWIFNNCSAKINGKFGLSNSTTRIGGFIGMINGTANTGKAAFVNCYAEFNVHARGGNNHRYGGFVGVYQVIVTDSYFVACEGAESHTGDFKGSAGSSDYIGCINGATNLTVIDHPDVPTAKAYIGTNTASKLTNFFVKYADIVVEETDTQVIVTIPANTIGWMGEYTVTYGTAEGTKVSGRTADTWTFAKGDEDARVEVNFMGFNYAIDGYIGEYDHWFMHAAAGFEDGTGTVADPFIIANAAQFAYLAKQVAAGNSFEGINFMLADDTDIVIDGCAWIPVGNSGSPFKGYLDGNNYGGATLTFVIDDVTGNSTLFGTFSGMVEFLDMYCVADFTGDAASVSFFATDLIDAYVASSNFTVAGQLANTGAGRPNISTIAFNVVSSGAEDSITTFENINVTGELYIENEYNCYYSSFITWVKGDVEYYNCTTAVDVTVNQRVQESQVLRSGGAAVWMNADWDLTVDTFINMDHFDIVGYPCAPRMGGIIADVQNGTVTVSNLINFQTFNFDEAKYLPTWYRGNVVGWARNDKTPVDVTPYTFENCFGPFAVDAVYAPGATYNHKTDAVNCGRIGFAVANSGEIIMNLDGYNALVESGLDFAILADGVELDLEAEDEYYNAAYFGDADEDAVVELVITFAEAYEDIDGEPVDVVAVLPAIIDPDWTILAADSFAGGTGGYYVAGTDAIPADPEAGTEEVPAVPAIEADPYIIETPAQMARMMLLLNMANSEMHVDHAVHGDLGYYQSTYKLAADLDMSGLKWISIQDSHNSTALNSTFEFDGDDHTIYNVELKGGNQKYGQSMFGKLYATIKNFNVDGLYATDFTKGGYGVPGAGAVVNAVYGGTIENVHVYNYDAVIDASNQFGLYVGVIAAYVTDNGTISNCSATGNIYVSDLTVDGSGQMIGGLVGRTQIATIENCVSNVDIYVETNNSHAYDELGEMTSNATMAIGGVIGKVEADVAEYVTNVIDTISTGSITIDYTGTDANLLAGGVIGYISKGTVTVEGCVATGAIELLDAPETLTCDIFGAVVGATKAAVTIVNTAAIGAAELVGGELVEEALEHTVTDSVAGLLDLSICEGARVRIDEEALENSGLRFDGYVDIDTFYALFDAGFDVYVGTAITTLANFEAVDGDWAALEEDVADGKLTIDMTDDLLEDYADYTFTGAIIDINNYNTQFVATTYFYIVLEDDTVVTVYADNYTIRSVAEVAEMALADTEAGYTAAQIAILNTYAGK